MAGGVRLLYVGRVDDSKGIGDLLEAVARMESTEYHLDIVGDNILGYGQPLDGYQADADALGVADQVTWHGWIDYYELGEYYDQADVMVHPAKWPEPFGRTIIEALEADCAIVCTDVGAPPWIARRACTMYPAGDANALARRLDDLVENPEYLSSLTDNAEDELARFQPDRVMQEINDLYSEVLA